MAISGLGTPVSALQTNQFRQDVTANNVANINTDGFRASTVQTADAAYINDVGRGTQVTGTYAPERPGPMAMDTASTTGGMVEQSNTELVTETTNRMGAQQAYGANTAMARTVDDMMQTLMDMRA